MRPISAQRADQREDGRDRCARDRRTQRKSRRSTCPGRSFTTQKTLLVARPEQAHSRLKAQPVNLQAEAIVTQRFLDNPIISVTDGKLDAAALVGESELNDGVEGTSHNPQHAVV